MNRAILWFLGHFGDTTEIRTLLPPRSLERDWERYRDQCGEVSMRLLRAQQRPQNNELWDQSPTSSWTESK